METAKRLQRAQRDKPLTDHVILVGAANLVVKPKGDNHVYTSRCLFEQKWYNTEHILRICADVRDKYRCRYVNKEEKKEKCKHSTLKR